MRKNIFVGLLIFLSTILILGGCDHDDEFKTSEEIVEMMTITKHRSSDYPDRTDYLSLEEAAIAGIEYILEFYEFDFENTYMELRLIRNTESTILDYNGQPVWLGSVLQIVEESSDSLIFHFGINAQNGNWLHVGASNHDSLQIDGYSLNDLVTKSIAQFERILPYIEEDEINEMLEVAKDYAQRHFRDSHVMRVEYNLEMVSGIRFQAEDEFGEIIYVLILRDTHVLIGFDPPIR